METYDAFISYSARDRRIAAALQSVLQKAGLARNKGRALRVFRDDTSLSATPSLWPTIEQALAQSRFFILLASLEAADSQWVNREVAYWLANKGIDTLLIGLTSGELAWDKTVGDFAWNEHTPLPPALKSAFPNEPKWVNLRAYRWADLRHYPMRRNSKFIAVAANFGATISGIPKENLVSLELDQERRERRRKRLTVGALVVVCLFAWWQWRQFVGQADQSTGLPPLPSETGTSPPRLSDKPITLTLNADLTLWIGDRMITRQSMRSELDAATNGDKDQTIYLRADRKLSYDDISNLLNSLSRAGYRKVGLVMESSDGK